MAFQIGSKTVEIESLLIKNAISIKEEISNHPIMHNGSVYVPIRAFGELFGADVRYDKYAKIIYFNLTEEQIKDKIFPKLGLMNNNPFSNNSLPSIGETSKTALTAKEIAQLRDRVGYVEIYDSYGNVVGSGSGVMIEPFYFVTNFHVAGEAAKVKVYIDGQVYDTQGRYVFGNKEIDLWGTILAESYDENGYPIGKQPTKYLPYSIELPEIGDKIYAIGSPLGLENTISDGIVSGIRNNNGTLLIQHTADTDFGSSGGAILNEYGEVIAIHSSGIPGSNLEFAIPMQYVVEEFSNLTKY